MTLISDYIHQKKKLTSYQVYLINPYHYDASDFGNTSFWFAHIKVSSKVACNGIIEKSVTITSLKCPLEKEKL